MRKFPSLPFLPMFALYSTPSCFMREKCHENRPGGHLLAHFLPSVAAKLCSSDAGVTFFL